MMTVQEGRPEIKSLERDFVRSIAYIMAPRSVVVKTVPMRSQLELEYLMLVYRLKNYLRPLSFLLTLPVSYTTQLWSFPKIARVEEAMKNGKGKTLTVTTTPQPTTPLWYDSLPESVLSQGRR